MKQTYSNPDGSHYSGNFSSNQGAVTGCIGASNNACAAKGCGVQQVGGAGVSFFTNDPIDIKMGVNSARHGAFQPYELVGVENPMKLGAGKQWTPPQNGGNNTNGTNYYKFDVNESNLSEFAGSGYPPVKGNLSHGECPQQNGGKKRKSKKKSMKKKPMKKKAMKKKSMKKKSMKKKSMKKRPIRRRTMKRKCPKCNRMMCKCPYRKSMKQKGGEKIQNLSNVPYSLGYSLGAPMKLNPSDSGLANPPPQTQYNHCEKNNF